MSSLISILRDVSGALSLFTSSAAVDVVGVYDAETFKQVFASARPMRAVVRETSRTMEHPIESGALIPDHRIINAVDIEMPLIIPAEYYNSAYNEIKQLYLKGTLLTVQTRAGVYSNMFIADMPHDEDVEMFDSITLGLHLREVLIVVSDSTYAPADSETKDSNFADSENNGIVSSSPAPAQLPTITQSAAPAVTPPVNQAPPVLGAFGKRG